MTGEKTARRKTSYSFELWDLFGTSCGPSAQSHGEHGSLDMVFLPGLGGGMAVHSMPTNVQRPHCRNSLAAKMRYVAMGVDAVKVRVGRLDRNAEEARVGAVRETMFDPDMLARYAVDAWA